MSVMISQDTWEAVWLDFVGLLVPTLYITNEEPTSDLTINLEQREEDEKIQVMVLTQLCETLLPSPFFQKVKPCLALISSINSTPKGHANQWIRAVLFDARLGSFICIFDDPAPVPLSSAA